MSKVEYTFLSLALETLEAATSPLSVEEIWNLAVEKGYANKISTQGKTPWSSVGAQIYVDIRDNPNSKFVKATTKPTKFWLKGKLGNKCTGDKTTTDIVAVKTPKISYKEIDLHPLLVTYVNVNQRFNCLCKTIMHQSSNRAAKGVNEWLHPDIVGVHFYDNDYSSEVVGLQKKLGYRNFKLYSFEMKRDLSFDNLRECYFQAVSNSSWANEGYLVAYDISTESDFLQELGRLNNAFGIGIIKLNPSIITQSEILYHSRISNELDWDTVEKLSGTNKDFRNFLLEITSEKRSNNIKKIYDEPLLDYNDEREDSCDERCKKYAIEKKIIAL